MTQSPLDCPVCNKELVKPRLLSCQHTVCERCVGPCTICADVEFHSVAKEDNVSAVDTLATFIVDTTYEEVEPCANCENVNLPMYFCETCRQSLCVNCRSSTHQAKMFSSHRIIQAEERARLRGTSVCARHNEPFILYCVEKRTLACVNCFNERKAEERRNFVSLDAGHKHCVEKIEKMALKLRQFQEDKREELEIREKVLAENGVNYENAKKGIFTLCQQIVDTVLSCRDEMLDRLETDRKESETICRTQIATIKTLVDPIRLCLMSAQILCVSASIIDVLQLSSDFSKRSQAILSRSVDKMSSIRQMDHIEARSEIANALEPFLGVSATWCASLSVGRVGSRESSGSGYANSYKRSANLCGPSLSTGGASISKFQALVDLSGAFDQLYARVDGPLKQLMVDLSDAGRQVQETQRDLTKRRCLIKSDSIADLVKLSVSVETRVGLLSAQLDDMQSDMQQIWQEHLDRVRRQQILYREKVEECAVVRERARQVLTAARQLAPFAQCIESMSALIDPKRCHPPDPAPMESICLQISTIEPDSEIRIQAIEKEEALRRQAQEAKRAEEVAERATAVKGLRHGKSRKKDISRLLLNTNRERSPGGTDTNLVSPFLKRISPTVREETNSELADEDVWDEECEFSLEEAYAAADKQFNEIIVSSGCSLSAPASPQPPVCEESSDSESCGTTATSSGNIPPAPSIPAGIVSSSKPIPMSEDDSRSVVQDIEVSQTPRSAVTSPVDNDISAVTSSTETEVSDCERTEKTPLAQRVTVDVDTSRASMLESLQSMFAGRSDGGPARAVFAAQRRRHDAVDEAVSVEDPEADGSASERSCAVKKEVKRRRKKRESVEREFLAGRQNEQNVYVPSEKEETEASGNGKTSDVVGSTKEGTLPTVGDSSVSLVPTVPFVPCEVFVRDENAKKLGSFEAKEKMLQALKDKVAKNKQQHEGIKNNDCGVENIE